MKEIQVTLPTDRKTLMEEFLKEFSLQATSYDFGESFRFECRIDDYQTNYALEELKARGIGVAYGDIVVRPVSLLISSRKEEDVLPASAGVNRQEILANLGEISGLSSSYLLMNILAAALAAFGLLNNDVVVIIASMIVAPLLGPIVLTSLGLLSLETTSYIKRGLLAEISGISVTVIVGALIGIVFQSLERIDADKLKELGYSEIMNRTALTVPTISLALLGGLAAGIIVARGLDVSIVGVAIAASLCPPAATIGILGALGAWSLALKATSLLLLNILAINLSCTGVFWIFGVKSRGLSKRQAEKVRRMNIIWIFVVTLLLILILLSAGTT
ncbi:MAG: TIGR00341 family protein [Candidatus Heimdallarchaeota archaeon]|nr:MAG: TIGR00341 family protein [Candidatus Heimdallarchaeota archaeon]